MPSFSATPSLAVDGGTTLSSVHPDIIKTQILARLDGPSLAAAACACSELHALTSEDDRLWRNACASTWPSTNEPRVRQLISTFPSGHRSFFSDSFPLLHHRHGPDNDCAGPDHHRRRFPAAPTPPTPPGLIISAVDIFHEDKLILSRVHETNTATGWFACAPFRVNLAGHVPIPVRHGGVEEDEWLGQLEEGLTLSWTVIDPARKRAADVSSRSPVSVQRQWLTGDVEVRFGTVVAEAIMVVVVVTCGCGGKEGAEVVELSMQVEGFDGRILNGRDSLVILQDAIENGERRRRRRGQDGKRIFEEYEEMKTRRRRRVQRIERALDLACIATGLTSFLFFCCFIFFT